MRSEQMLIGKVADMVVENEVDGDGTRKDKRAYGRLLNEQPVRVKQT